MLRVGAAFPDPPFDAAGEPSSGFDVDLMRAVAAELDLRWEVVRYRGDGFEGIFGGLNRGDYDAVASGTTITGGRWHRSADPMSGRARALS
jgi:polar amino acid transport system substrate-binding protein